MDYTKIVKQAWEIAWKRRYLWVFGFFAGMGGNTIGNIGGHGGNGQASRLVAWVISHPALLGGLILGGIMLWCVLTALQSLSYGALIHATGSLAAGRPNDFDASLDAGFRWFWRVFGMQVLFGLVIIALTGLAAAPPILMFVTKKTGLIVLGVAWLVIVLLPFLCALAVASIVWDYAIRYGVLHDLSAGAAIGAGWRLFRGNLGRSAGIWGVMCGLGVAFGFALIIPILVLGLPFLIAGAFNPWLGIVPAVLFGLPVVVVLVSIYGVFDVAYWSGAFAELTSVPAAPHLRAPEERPQPGGMPGQPFDVPPLAGMA